jgi:exopolyphosphatase/guanosine-5'-triphosphate,3'-diphosphate pyrophosphatase
MKVAAIDIGTNSVLLTIAEANEKFLPLIEKKETTKLGEQLERTNLISKNAITRTLQAVKEFVKISHQKKAEKIILLGTYALRKAKNKNEFADLIKEKLGHKVFILSGEEEGQFSFDGAMVNLKRLKPNTILIDIGGGSTEVIWGENGRPKGVKSIKLGALTLTEKFCPSGNWDKGSFQRISTLIEKKLNPIKITLQDFSLIGTGGTITTLSALNLSLIKYDAQKVHGSKLDVNQIGGVLFQLLSMTKSQRKKFLRVDPERTEIILAGTVILKKLLQISGKDEIIVSHGGLRWGAIKNQELFA